MTFGKKRSLGRLAAALLVGLIIATVLINGFVGIFFLGGLDAHIASSPRMAGGGMTSYAYQHQRQRQEGGDDEDHGAIPTTSPTVYVMPKQESSVDSAGFVHIGKTGGSTISTMIRNGCSSFAAGPCRNITNESPVSKLVEHYYHVTDFWRLPESKHKSFIVSVRDPFDRTVSALLYHHPENAKAYDLKLGRKHAHFGPLVYGTCFPTLEAFAQLLYGNASTTCNYPYSQGSIVVDDCEALACAAIHGRARFFSHMFFNYRNILGTKLPMQRQPTVYVIRQERFWEDWKHLNQLLLRSEDAAKDKKGSGGVRGDYDVNDDERRYKVERNVTGIRVAVTRDVSTDGRRKICLALKTEYEAYFKLLQYATNIHDVEMEQCVQVASRKCPILDIESMV